MFNTMTRRFLHLSLAAGGLLAWACADPNGGTGGDSSDSGEGSMVAREVLASLADNVFAPTYAEFSTASDALAAAAAAHATAVTDGGDTDLSLTSVQSAYTDAMLVWQRAELLQVGPAAGASGIAGEFVRDEVYSWPSVNTCRIDQEVVAGEFDSPDFTDTRLVNVYGFDALEYLLFANSVENTCPPQLPINAEGQWSALSEDELQRRRTSYAVTVATALAGVADTLETTWAEGGTWHGYLTDPSSGPLESTDAALDEILRGMFYIDKVVKDVKIARPGGIKDCSADACAADVESQWASLSKEQAIANLQGFSELMWAGPDAQTGVGFDDLLASLGEDTLAQQMLSSTQGAIAALEAIDGDFATAVTADPGALDGAHAAVVMLTDDLKGDFPTVLRLNIPTEAAGDAD